MVNLAILLGFIGSIWYMLKKRSAGLSKDTHLTKIDKGAIWIFCLLNPIIAGAIFYYGWKSRLPGLAAQANRISFFAFGIELLFFLLVEATSLAN